MLASELLPKLRRFRETTAFAAKGGVITDLDGTALHERDGRVYVAESVAEGLKALVDLGRPVVVNTLRFPLNVVRTFGREWSSITSQPVPLVSLNGAVVGLLMPEGEHEVVFQELCAFPLSREEVAAAVARIHDTMAAGLTDIVLFLYARDWRAGEVVWTPHPDRVEALRAKYLSASEVFTGPLEAAAARLEAQEVCMLALQVDIPEDRRMAYQHVNPNQFLTTVGVDKLSGAREAAARLDFDLQVSVGAGDTVMDRFLEGVGLALHVGPVELAYQGRIDTLRLGSPHELGYALFELARLEPQASAS